MRQLFFSMLIMCLSFGAFAQTEQLKAYIVFETNENQGFDITTDFSEIPIDFNDRLDLILGHFEIMSKDFKREEDFKAILEQYLKKGTTRL